MKLLSDHRIGARHGRSGSARILIATLLLAGAVPVTQGAFSSSVQAALTNTLDVLVEDVDTSAPITDFKYIINVDNTGTTGQRTPEDGCSPETVGYPDTCDWTSMRTESSAPIYTQGDQTDFPLANLPDGRYLISVLADGYKLDGEHFTMPLDDASGPVVVALQSTAAGLPDATVQAAIFEDISPTNSAPDVPAEHGLAGWRGGLTDTLGDIQSDVYGNPLCTIYVNNDVDAGAVSGSGGNCVSYCYVVDGGVDIGIVLPTGPDAASNIGRCPSIDEGLAPGDPTGLTMWPLPAGYYSHPMPGDDFTAAAVPASAVIMGKLIMPHLGTSRYAMTATPPDGQAWAQTTTLEGNHDWDSWVMEGSTGLDTEFVVAGEPFPADIFGWVQPTGPIPPGATGSITGVVDAVKVYVPAIGGIPNTGDIWGGLTGGKIDKPIAYPWVALSDLGNGDTAVWIGQGDVNGAVNIPNVADGTYMLTWWDEDQNYILNWQQVTVTNGEAVDMGVLPLSGWWTTYDGYVFNDTNRNGIHDWTDTDGDGCPELGEGELGVPNYGLTMRRRENSLMDRGSTAAGTDACGHYVFESAYPMTQWLVMEAYNDLYYTTGITYQADNQPTPTTVLGAGVDVSTLPIIGLGGRMDWGVHAYDATGASNGADPRNGGIVGTVSYDTTRNELDPRFAAVEDWQPGVSNLGVELWTPVPCPIDSGTGLPTAACDPTQRYQLASDGSYMKGELINTYLTETWAQPGENGNANGDGDCVPRDVDGNELTYPDKQALTNSPSDCLEAPLMGVQFQKGFSSVDGNYGFGDGCFAPNALDPAAPVDAPVCLDPLGQEVEFEALPGGMDYLVHVVIPDDAQGRPQYNFTREEDINIAHGDPWVPQLPPPACAGALHTVDVADSGPSDTYPAASYDVDPDTGELVPGTQITVPASTPTDNPTFADPELGSTPYEGQPKPICDTKLVPLANGRSIVPTFNVFTDVPVPGRFWGLLVDDLNFSSNKHQINYGEKSGIPFAPVGIYDYRNRLVHTAESDYSGLFDVLLPSTDRISCPTPSGVCPGVYRFVGNDPGVPGRLNPSWNPQFRTIAAEFEAFPGLIIPADLAPTQVGVTVQLPGGQAVQVKCPQETDTPQLFAVNRPYVNSNATGLARRFTINGLGFGASQGTLPNLGQVTFDATTNLTVVSWSDTQIVVSVPTTVTPGAHQLAIRSSNGRSTVSGLTFHVRGSGYNPTLFEVGPRDNPNYTLAKETASRWFVPTNALPATADHAIQNAINTAGSVAGTDLIVVYPGAATPLDSRINPRGAYYENLILNRPVKLQGVGPGGFQGSTWVPGSLVDGGAFGGDSPVAAAWQDLIDGLTWSGNQTVNDGAIISVYARQTGAGFVFGSTFKAAIDGFDLRGGDQQGFPNNINQIGGGPTGLPGTVVTQGGAIFANAFARNLQITNNTVQNNGGGYGTIRVGTPDVGDNQNDSVRIANNRIVANGGTNLAGAIALFTGSNDYEVAGNDICGNFSAEYGGGISAYGLSPNGDIHDNRVWFNRSYDEGAGIMIAGELPANPSALSPGSGPVDIYNNLIQANLANDDGGGLRFLMVGDFPINVYNNIIVNNVSTHEGGGVALDDATNVRFYNNTVMKNQTTATAMTSNGLPAAAGLSTGANSAQLQATLPLGSPTFSNPVLFNNVFWDNRAGNKGLTTVEGLGLGGPGDIYNWDMGSTDGSGPLTPTDSVLQTLTDTTPDASNVVADPAAVAPYDTVVSFEAWRTNAAFIGAIMVSADLPPNLLGNYHLTAASPAVDLGAASKTGVNAPAFDIDNQGRPFGGGYDSGADEFQAASTPSVTPFLLDDFNAGGNINNLTNTWRPYSGLTAATPIRRNNDQAFANSFGTAFYLSSLGNNQLAAFTFANSTINGSALMLKGTQGNVANPDRHIRVRAIAGNVVVATTTNHGISYTNRATFPGVFANGDTFVASALANGTVSVYRITGTATTLLGSVVIPTSGPGAWAPGTGGGRIGMQLPSGARVDNFSGQTLP